MRGDFHGRVARGKQPGGTRRSCWCLSAWKTRHWDSVSVGPRPWSSAAP